MVEEDGDSSKFFASKILLQQDLIELKTVTRALNAHLTRVDLRTTAVRSSLTESAKKEDMVAKLKQFENIDKVSKVMLSFGERAFAYILLEKDYVLVTDDNGNPLECEQVQALIRINMTSLVRYSSSFANTILILKYNKDLDIDKRLSASVVMDHPFVSRGVPCWGIMRTINAELKLRYLHLQESKNVAMVLDDAWANWNLTDIVSIWRAYLAQDLNKEIEGTSEYRNLLAVSEKGVGRYGKAKQKEQKESEDTGLNVEHRENQPVGE